MSEESTLFKDVFFKPAFIHEFADALRHSLPGFNKKTFVSKVFDKEWGSKELKQRVKHIVQVLNKILPDDYEEAVSVILAVISHLRSQNIKDISFGYMCLPEYIETYGIEHYTTSVKAMEQVTEFMSCEFAVRPFIIKYEQRMMKQMLKWSKSKSAKVRRLASEGCRPRLPWAMALPQYKKDPTAVLPILESLKKDDDVWVRKSVANNLNDISKDNPELAISIFKQWYGNHTHTDWIVKHAARTLLKQGNPELMKMFGFAKDDSIKLLDFKIDTPKVKVGDSLQFSSTIHNSSKKKKIIRVEYAIYYLLANGKHSRKVFKVSEKEYDANTKTGLVRKQSFRKITTRVFYPGVQKVALIINGHESDVHEFTLVE